MATGRQRGVSRRHRAWGQPRAARTARSRPPAPALDPVRLRPRQGDGCDTGVDDGMSERATRSSTGTTDIKAHNTAPRMWVSSRCRGRLRALQENVWLCLSSRPPSGAGRSPYHSEPSIEAPDSSTLSRQVKAKPQQTRGSSDVRPGLRRRRQGGVVVLGLRHGPPGPPGHEPRARASRSANRPEHRTASVPGYPSHRLKRPRTPQ